MADVVVAAIISANSPVLFEDICIPVIASETMSHVSASEVFPAVASANVAGNAETIEFTSYPAIAKYFSPSALSRLENLVLFPISMATFSSFSKSFPVAPEIAETSFIPASKSIAVFALAAPIATTPAVTGRNFLPRLVMDSPAFVIPEN